MRISLGALIVIVIVLVLFFGLRLG